MMILLAINVYAVLNPSAVYCEELGYDYSVIETQEGQLGKCILPDGSEADAWQFLKGEVKPEYSYCKQQGYEIKLVTDPRRCASIFSQDCALCVVDGKETEVTKLMNLSFLESVCGDGSCTIEESYLSCPQDCESGSHDGYCDGLGDGICDPDCTPEEDIDCPEEFEFPETAECIDNDELCHCKCIGQDSDCISADITACPDEPKEELFPEPEIVGCGYDGKCYPECIGQKDIDCLCVNPNSKECPLNLAKEGIPLGQMITIALLALIIVLLGSFMAYFASTKKREKLLELQNYIINTEKQGYTEAQIRAELIKDGWPEREIERAFKTVKR